MEQSSPMIKPRKRGRPKAKAPLVSLSARVPLDLFNLIDRLARERNESISSVVGKLLRQPKPKR